MSPHCVQKRFQLHAGFARKSRNCRYPVVGTVYHRAYRPSQPAGNRRGISLASFKVMAVTENIRRTFAEGGAKVVLTRGFKKLVRPAFQIGTLVFIESDLTKPFPELRPV